MIRVLIVEDQRMARGRYGKLYSVQWEVLSGGFYHKRSYGRKPYADRAGVNLS